MCVCEGRQPLAKLLCLDSLCSNCKAVTDIAAEELADGCRDIQTLVLSGCPRLSDQVLYTMAEKLQRLETLDVSKCPMVSGWLVARLGTVTCAPDPPSQ